MMNKSSIDNSIISRIVMSDDSSKTLNSIMFIVVHFEMLFFCHFFLVIFAIQTLKKDVKIEISLKKHLKCQYLNKNPKVQLETSHEQTDATKKSKNTTSRNEEFGFYEYDGNEHGSPKHQLYLTNN